jgi:hypothetical protein
MVTAPVVCLTLILGEVITITEVLAVDNRPAFEDRELLGGGSSMVQHQQIAVLITHLGLCEELLLFLGELVAGGNAERG